MFITAQITKSLWSASIRYQSDAIVSRRYSIGFGLSAVCCPWLGQTFTSTEWSQRCGGQYRYSPYLGHIGRWGPLEESRLHLTSNSCGKVTIKSKALNWLALCSPTLIQLISLPMVMLVTKAISMLTTKMTKLLKCIQISVKSHDT